MHNITLPSVKTHRDKHRLTICDCTVIAKSPTGEGSVCLNSLGFIFIRHAVRARLWFTRSLDQVNSLLGKANQAGDKLFLGGLFLFFPSFYSVKHVFSSFLFF